MARLWLRHGPREAGGVQDESTLILSTGKSSGHLFEQPQALAETQVKMELSETSASPQSPARTDDKVILFHAFKPAEHSLGLGWVTDLGRQTFTQVSRSQQKHFLKRNIF